ncbi:MAG: hypothetical protein JSV33_14810 [bacterium]|nr:MAG: hypothetical protein JSV33_14810 [bacterium]
MRLRSGITVLLCCAVCSSPGPACRKRTGDGNKWEKRWVYISTNLYIDENVPKLDSLFQRARHAGYNGILFDDFKTFTWWELKEAHRWLKNARAVRRAARESDLEFIVSVFPFGRSGSLLWHDPNLASGMPVRDAPLRERNGLLVPEQTAILENGSFEKHRGNRLIAYSFQDGPGQTSFIDTQHVREGGASLRIEAGGDAESGLGRFYQEIAVRPWQQYRIRVWMRARHLTADKVQIVVSAGDRTLQWQDLVTGEGDGVRYLRRVEDLTTDWIEQRVTFNSLDNSSVLIYVGVWGGRDGTVWWDDLRIDAVPTLNLLRRDSLPLRITGIDGTIYREGDDFEYIADSGLGQTRWPGSYDTRHDPPPIRLTPESRIVPGERVLLSCYHAVIVHTGQVACSMDEPAVFVLCGEQVRRLDEALDPDGYLMSHNEIRCAGWEPRQMTRYRTSGELFAFNIAQCRSVAEESTGGVALFIWSDMYDPHHNARNGYYLVNNTVEGSWEGLASDIAILNWSGRRESLEFFAGRGHRQILAAYYDGDTRENYRMWIRAAEDIPGIIGTMYTTWSSDFDDLEEFAELWWGVSHNMQ